MQVTVDGQVHDFIPIKVYREAHSLPPTFSIALFEPKDFTGLAAIDKSGAAMNKLRQAILNTLPQSFTLKDALALVDTLQAVFFDIDLNLNQFFEVVIEATPHDRRRFFTAEDRRFHFFTMFVIKAFQPQGIREYTQYFPAWTALTERPSGSREALHAAFHAHKSTGRFGKWRNR